MENGEQDAASERETQGIGVLRYFHPVLPARQLRRRPVCVRVAGRAYALFRDNEGRPAALDNSCPHRRAPLSLGTVRPDGRLACAYHGWHFDGSGQGRSPASPDLRQCNVGSYQVVERHDYLWLADHATPTDAFPDLHGDGFDAAGSISTLFEAPIEVVLDNISEDEHFAYIHSTFGWDEQDSSGVHIETTNLPDRSHVRLTGRQRHSPLAPLGGVMPGDRFHNEWWTRFDPVHAIYTFGWVDPASGAPRPIRTRAAVFLVPETPRSTRAHMFLFSAIAPSVQRLLRPLSHWLTRRVARLELERDARFVAHLADVPAQLRGMRLTKFDKALIHNRKLLRTCYWGATARDGVEPPVPTRPTRDGSVGVVS